MDMTQIKCVTILFAGASDYIAQAEHFIPQFHDMVEGVSDDTKQFAVKASPSYNIVLNGTDSCIWDFPSRFSLLFKFKVESRRFAVTLFEISDQLSVTLDTCGAQLILSYGGSKCAFRNISLSLKQDLGDGEWHKIGLSFSDDHLSLFVDCRLTEWREIPGCPVQCNEETTISVLTPNKQSSCSSFGEVYIMLPSASLLSSPFPHSLGSLPSLTPPPASPTFSLSAFPPTFPILPSLRTNLYKAFPLVYKAV